MAYNEEEINNIFDSILERIEEGEAVRTILKENDMPSSRTFFKWLAEDEVKVKQYAHACSTRADVMFEEIIEIADASHSDKKIVNDEEVTDNEVIQRSRLRVDARKWAVSKLNPKKYGDKLDVTTDGKEIKTPMFGSNPLNDK